MAQFMSNQTSKSRSPMTYDQRSSAMKTFTTSDRLSQPKNPKRRSPAKAEENPTFKPALTKASKKLASKKSSPLRD